MEPILDQSQLQEEILALGARTTPQSLTVSNVKSASPFVLALLSSAKIVLASFGDRKIKIGDVSLSPVEVLDLIIAALTGIAQS